MALRPLSMFLWAGCVFAAGPSFEKDVLPILSARCFQCHSEKVQMGKLDLRSPDSMRKGGTKGPALVNGDSKHSLLVERVADQSMPVGNPKLTAAEMRVLREWIDGGAAGTAVIAASKSATHWAFVAPKKPAVPKVKNTSWVRTPVDAFVLAALEAKGIAPVDAADKLTLLRRAYLDTTGLPPSREELASNEPHERVVEKLLNSPQYGERWARHWLDVVRYAESNGYERDGTKPNVWRYRDYVIDAFNNDKPFDRFVTEQLAGDELPGSNAEMQIATTFLRLGTWDDEPAEPMLDRFDQLDDILGTTSASLMGITLRCARCHDHKFEPFTQKDYYRTLAIFDPLKRPLKDRQEFDRLAGTEREIAAYTASKEKADGEVAERERSIDVVKRGVLKRLFADKSKIDESVSFLESAEVALAFGTAADRRTKEQKALVEKFNKKLDAVVLQEADVNERLDLDQWKREIAAIHAARMPEPPRAYVWYEEGAPPETKLLVRGDPSRPGELVDPGVPTVLGKPDPAAIRSGKSSSGRRLWLANWMTSRENPLVARVIVNRIWQWTFGDGIVASANDFGVNGQRPVNQELLDWLAVELIDSGWSIKHIQRLILNSNTFRLSSAWNEDAGKADPEGKLMWRWKPRRLEAESLRDMMLAAGGRLNTAQHGPSVYPKLPEAVLAGQSVPGQNWGKSDETSAARRSVYIFSKRSLAVPELELLDTPDTTSSCEQRTVSTTGPQALTFLNGEFAHAQAKSLGARVAREVGPDAREQVAHAYQLALSRKPTDEELKVGAQFLSKNSLESFALVLLNSNEFFYLN